MNPIQLPLVQTKHGQALVLDNSFIEKMSCWREFEYAALRRRTPSSPKPALHFGGAVHEALKLRYTASQSEAVLPEVQEQQLAALAKAFEQNEPPAGDHRTFDLATRVITRYNEKYQKEPFRLLTLPSGKPFVEASFLRYLGKVLSSGSLFKSVTMPVYYSGRIDLGVRDNEGHWVIDHKTAFMFGDSFREDMETSPQMYGYCWELQQQGLKPTGFIINALRIRRPTKAALLDPEQLVTLEDFQRIPVHVRQDQIDEWKENTLDLIEEMLHVMAGSTFPQKKKNHCVGKYGRCQFFDVCNLPKENRESYLDSALFQDNNWSALNLEEKV